MPPKNGRRADRPDTFSSSGLTQVGDLFTPQHRQILKGPTPIQQRLMEGAAAIAAGEVSDIVYQHSVLCQVGMPYRDPGQGIRRWDRKQGSAHLLIEAGIALHPKTDQIVEIGLPWGSKPRLILAYLNAEALRTGSPEIEVESSLTAFVRRLGLDTGGKSINRVKDQLARLSASRVFLGIKMAENRSANFSMQIVTAFDLWFPKNDEQRVLWPSTVRLSGDYFQTLTEHAVPLREAALACLSNNAMGLDIYAWLAQRLHRVPPAHPQFITWVALSDQFGSGYGQLRDFRRVFKRTLAAVKTQYPDAKFTVDEHGMKLHNSPPPVAKRLVALP